MSHRARFACLVVFVIGVDTVVGSAPIRAQQPFTKEVYQDFRGKKPLVNELKIVGPGRDEACKSEEAGLRITLPKTRKWLDPTGVRLAFDLAGDFEITGSYELLSVDKPLGGGGVGVAFNVVAKTDYKKFSRFGRFMLPEDRSVHVAECRLKDRPDENKYISVPTEARTGKLRMIRTGSKLHFLVADGPGSVFKEILQAEFTLEDVEVVRFGVGNNGSLAGVDIRLIDWRIRYDTPVGQASPAPTGSLKTDATRQGLMVVMLALGLGTILLLALALGVWVYLRRRKTDENPNVAAKRATSRKERN